MRVARVFVLLLSAAVVGGSVAAATTKHTTALAGGPLPVEVVKTYDGNFVYLVDGEPQFLVGMGYNPIYRHLDPEERAARYDKDFGKMRTAGVNTIMGWDADKGYEQDKFDWLTLDKAWEHGLGVVMPFYLPSEGDYEDPVFREEIKAMLVAKVAAYKDHPSIRMWGVGNEVIEPLIERGEPGQEEAFGRFYLELADAVHEVDPDHPVIYREAEEGFLPFATWYDPVDGIERPWLLYGMNSYTMRLEQILADWTSLGYDLPLFVTEFAPEGWDPVDRLDGYLTMWGYIRAYPGLVLGAAPYVWTTDGPEPVDLEFGLMDSHGNPVDQTFDALANEFRLANLWGTRLASAAPSPAEHVSSALLNPTTPETQLHPGPWRFLALAGGYLPRAFGVLLAPLVGDTAGELGRLFQNLAIWDVLPILKL